MPTYNFKDKDTDEEFELTLSLAEREEFLAAHPNVIQLLSKNIGYIGDNYNMHNKVPAGFRDVLKQIKKQNRGSTIDSGNLGSI